MDTGNNSLHVAENMLGKRTSVTLGSEHVGSFENWGLSLGYSLVLCRVHTTAEKLENSFISMVGPTVHTNPSRKGSFSKTLFKAQEFGNAGFAC